MASTPKKPRIAPGSKSESAEQTPRPRARNAVRVSTSRVAEAKRSPSKTTAAPSGTTESRPTQNALRPTSTRETQQSAPRPFRRQSESPRAEKPRAAEAPPAPSPRPLDKSLVPERPAAAPAAASVPQEVLSRFVQIGRKYYFADGTHAFTDRGRRLTTPSENTEVIRSLVLIAQVRGWNDVTLTGTERFRKDAWFAAKAAGLTVRGYKPTIFEQERMSRTLDRMEAAPARAPRATPPRDAAPAASSDRAAPGQNGPNAGPESRLIVGRLVDYGRAPYKQDPHESISYFLKLQTGRGERTLWGVDLERAFREAVSRPQLGDEVGVQARGQELVVVKAAKRDAEGKVVGEKNLDAHRNRWVVEKSAFFQAQAADAEISRDIPPGPRDSAGVRTDSKDTSTHLRTAELFARQKIRHPEDQKRFVAAVRQALAQSAAKGESIAPIQRRTSSAPKRPANRPATPNPRKTDLVRE